MNVISQAVSGNVTVRLIKRTKSDFVIVYDSPNMAAIAMRMTDRVRAGEIFRRAIQICEDGLSHPAWQRLKS